MIETHIRSILCAKSLFQFTTTQGRLNSMWMMVLYVCILLFLFVVKLKKPRSLFLIYFRAFLPSWKFFDLPSDRIHFSVISDRQKIWHPILLTLPFRLSGLFLNARVNDLLARRSLIEEFLFDVQLLSESEVTAQSNTQYRGELVERLTSFNRVKMLALDELGQIENNFERFQFKIKVNTEDVVQSDWLSN